jgi:16S rRNA (guanine527-N7)-methyltransferase
MPETIFRYFPSLSDIQKQKISRLKGIYDHWNNMINVISRKDMDNFFIHHVLHSLSIAKVFDFKPGSTILDVGTGGGFPGIPLAIIFPDTQFTLLDSISKKIRVVAAVAEELELNNLRAVWKRAEEEKGRYDFVISRAVTEFSPFVKLVSKNISGMSNHPLKNGIIYLKGGDLENELSMFRDEVLIWEIRNFFQESFFDTKKIVYLPH